MSAKVAEVLRQVHALRHEMSAVIGVSPPLPQLTDPETKAKLRMHSDALLQLLAEQGLAWEEVMGVLLLAAGTHLGNSAEEAMVSPDVAEGTGFLLSALFDAEARRVVLHGTN